MSDEMLERLRGEVHQKMGRNLALFQQVEGLMKFLLSHSKIQAHPQRGTPATVAGRKDSIHRKTMGQLLDPLFKIILGDIGEAEDSAEAVTEVRITTTFTVNVGNDPEVIQKYRADFDAMNDQRNELAHNFLSICKFASEESMRSAIEYLDRQREQTLPLHGHLKGWVDGMLGGYKALSDFFNSEEGRAQFELSFLQSSRIVALLIAASKDFSRPDGWTPLARAGQFICQEAAEDLAAIHPRYGYRTLKSLVLGAELFEAWDEPTPKGGFRTLYRLKQILAV